MNLRQLVKNAFGGEPKAKLFDNIIGHDAIKETIMDAINAPKPVHILLVGPVSIAKTQFLLDMQRFYGKQFHLAIGGRTSRAGLGDMLIKNPNLEFLGIDELETMPRKDQTLLLSICEGGMVSETLYKKKRGTMEIKTTVIATSNNTKGILPALLSRFWIIRMKEYQRDEFVDITVLKLKTENVTEEIAEFIGECVFDTISNPNIRDCVQIARMCGNDRDKIIKKITGQI